jgi:hypothetical protein
MVQKFKYFDPDSYRNFEPFEHKNNRHAMRRVPIV